MKRNLVALAVAALLTGMVATDALAAGHAGFGSSHMGGRTDLQSVHSVHRDSVARGPCLAGKPWITVSLKSEHCSAAAGGSGASAAGTVGQSRNGYGRKSEHDRVSLALRSCSHRSDAPSLIARERARGRPATRFVLRSA
jgi:hypothetical protein